jgi:predicted type IV restriction endonuclease
VELVADRVESLCGYKPDPDTVAAFLRERIDLRAANSVTTARPGPFVRPQSPPPTHVRPSDRELSRVGFELNGQFHAARNARDVLVKVFTELERRDSTFPDRFAALPKHGRTRRYLARTSNELYPDRPDLARDFSQQLKSGWWLGINLSRAAISRIIEMACEVAGLRFGADLKVDLGD